jgi:hypothetical protein
MHKWLIEEALETGVWVGSPGVFYRATPHPDGPTGEAFEDLSGRTTDD